MIETIVVGVVAGFLAGVLTRGRGYGCFINLVVGMLGGFLGGWVFDLLSIEFEENNKPTQLLISTLGAVILLSVLSIFRRKHPEID